MGVVQRQSVSSTLISYIGAGLGFINKLVLLPRLITVEEVGLMNALPVIAVMFAQFAALGTSSATLRFFPLFRNKSNHHNGFLAGFFLINLLGFILFTLIYLNFRDDILNIWADRAPLLAKFQSLILPFVFFYLLINFFEAYLRSLYKIAVMTFVREILFRLPITVGVALYAWGLINFDTFVYTYVGLVGCMALIPIVYLIYLKEFLITPNFGAVWKTYQRQIIIYTLITFLSYAGTVVLNQFDIFMLTMLKTLEDTGLFTVWAFASTVILIPWKALRSISSPIVADHWKNNDIQGIHTVYQRTSLINLITGLFIFLGLWLNRENLIAIIGEAYRPSLYVLFIMGVARVIEMVTGLNGTILVTSKKYMYDILFQTGLVVIGIFANFWLIPIFSYNGAALATGLVIAIINMARIVAVRYFFGIQPFSPTMWKVVLIGIGAFILIDLIATPFPFYFDLLIRSLLFTLLYVGIVLKWEASSDVNDYVWKMARKFGVARLIKPIVNR